MKIAGCCKNSKGINVKALQQQGFLRSEIRTIKFITTISQGCIFNFLLQQQTTTTHTVYQYVNS
jgi:hypothetical protein